MVFIISKTILLHVKIAKFSISFQTDSKANSRSVSDYPHVRLICTFIIARSVIGDIFSGRRISIVQIKILNALVSKFDFYFPCHRYN